MNFIYTFLGIGFICLVIGITFVAYGYMQDSNLFLDIGIGFVVAFGALVLFALVFNAFFLPLDVQYHNKVMAIKNAEQELQVFFVEHPEFKEK